MRLPHCLLHGNLVVSPADGEWCNGSTTGSEPVFFYRFIGIYRGHDAPMTPDATQGSEGQGIMTSDKDVKITYQEKTPPFPTSDSERKRRRRWWNKMIATFFVAPICLAVGAGFVLAVCILVMQVFLSEVPHKVRVTFGLFFISAILAGGIFAARKGFRWFLGFMEDD